MVWERNEKWGVFVERRKGRREEKKAKEQIEAAKQSKGANTKVDNDSVMGLVLFWLLSVKR